jgi:transposase
MTRPVSFDAVDYKHRNVVERFYSRMKNWRGLASRYDKARRRLSRQHRPRRDRRLAGLTSETRP